MRPTLFVPLLLLLLTLSLSAQTQPKDFLAAPPVADKSVYSMLTSSGTRSVISLNGAWQSSRDDGDSWQTVRVPSCYSEEGSLQFKRSFQIPPEMLRKYRWKLVCYGIQYQSTVSINGQFVGQHESGMPFSMLVPEEVKLGATNTIQVDVSNRLDYTSTVPHRKLLLGNRTYGGIYRDIMLVGVPKVWVDDVRFRTTVGSSAQARFIVRVTSAAIKGMTAGAPGDSAGRTLTIPGDQGEFDLNIVMRSASSGDSTPASEVARAVKPFSIASKRTANIDVSLPMSGPNFWAPGAPYLYTALVQVRYQGALIDEQTLKVGFRELSTRGESVLFNGQPIELKGVVYSEDSKLYGASLPYDLMRRDMQTIKDMGANLIRFADGVPHPYLLQLCDEFGLMAWIDASIGTPPASLFGDQEYLRRALDRIRFVIDEGGRNTCVAAYGLSAPIPGGSSAALAAVRQMRSLIDSLDHRPFYFAATSWADPALRKLVDLPGISTFDLDPARMRAILQGARRELAGHQPLVLLSYGKFVQLGNHGGYSDPISIESQAKYISDVYGIISEAGAAGGIYWSYNDYRTDRPILTVNNDTQYVATCGLYALDRELRQGASMLAALYTNQKTPEVLIGDYTPPSNLLFIIVGIACAVIFLLLINNSRRFRENVFRAVWRPFNFFADIRDQRILSSVQTTVLGIVISMTLAVMVSSLTYFYRMDEGFDAVLSAIVTSDGLKSFLNHIIWRPELSVICFTLFFFLGLLAVAGIIRLCAIFVRNRIFFSDAYVIAIWAALPVLFLIPPAMILFRLLAVPGASFMVFLILIGVLGWILYRVLRGTAVVYDVRPLKVYGYALGGLAVIVMLMIVTSGTTRSTVSYLREGIGGWYQGG